MKSFVLFIVYFCLSAQRSVTALPLLSPLQLDIQAAPSLPEGMATSMPLDGLEQMSCDRIMEGAKNLSEVTAMLKGKEAGEPEPSGLEMLLAAIHLFTGLKDTKCITSWRQLTETSAVYVRVTGTVNVEQYEKINESPCGMLICDIDGTTDDEAEEDDGDDDDEADSAPAAQLTTSIQLQKPNYGGGVQEWGACTGGLQCAAGLICNVQSQWYAQCIRAPEPVDVCRALQKRDQCKANVLCDYDTSYGCRKKDAKARIPISRICKATRLRQQLIKVVHKTREVDDCKWTDAPNTPEGEAPVDADEEQACFANGGMFTAYAIGKHPVNSFTAGFECCGGADDDTASPAVTNLLSLSTGGSTPCEQIRNRGQCKQEPSCTYDTSYGCRTNPNYKQEDEDEDDWDSAVPEWGPCTGGLKCKEGLKCYTQNNWYSQCLRGGCPPGWACDVNAAPGKGKGKGEAEFDQEQVDERINVVC